MLANTIGKLDFHSWSIISVCLFTLLSILLASMLREEQKEEPKDKATARKERGATKNLFDMFFFLIVFAVMLYLSFKKGAIARGFELSARLGYSVSEIVAWILLFILFWLGSTFYDSAAPTAVCILVNVVIGVIILALLLADFYVLEPKLVSYLEQYFGPAHTSIFTPSAAGKM